MRIAVVAPSSRFSEEAAAQVTAIAARARIRRSSSIFHPQCFLTHNHFAGTDAARVDALVEVANDPASTRSGSRAAATARAGSPKRRSPASARRRADKTYLGYSDAGFLLAGLYRAGYRQCRARADAAGHGPRGRRGGGGARARLAGRRDRRRRSSRASSRPAPRRLQHHRARHAARHAARARPGRTMSCCSRRSPSICTRSTGRCST